ncbi:bifunctional non-homologous end joining protein LigD [Microbacterium sp. W4I4]|uniref:ATP-dependent DNA ligase n=1 Tax=Microbacterium sp. W4I4 TaxID=3042295 RepID=UPI00278927E9|nr:ATP-dependent DNA ligase [Microbacterium sp. W4I4]MDQ0615921.1 bifunctional non-homologous end joining protein LigD [Microbacterium sp. W4I4]
MAASGQVVQVDGRRLRVTNLEKVVYPDAGTTKGEILSYYSRIAPVMLPHLRGRPVTRKRWVDGVGTADAPAESFFTKQLEQGAPDWVRRMPIEHSDGPKEYPLADDAATLAWFAQIAALELHVPQWRFTHSGGRGKPDRLVLDLDPGPGVGLAQCAEVARVARGILTGMGLEPMPVTSGSKGIHLYARLPTSDDGTGRQTSDDVSAVAKELARLIEADHPDLATGTMAKSARGGKVFIDWSQNSASKTTIAPYSLRGRARPWVAAPRTWEELDDPELRHLEFEEVLERMDAGIDPLAALAPPSSALAAYLAKRDAAKTPEPMPRTAYIAPGGDPRFVIQEHHASSLHCDLRIERDGVLISWAVPKGIPESTDRNHLAVMTEPHPMEYLDFEGEIPRGEYGAGSMTVWDTGVVALEKWRDDEVIGTFTGQAGGRLGSARLALIRTGGEGEKSQWLLHRMVPTPHATRRSASAGASGARGPATPRSDLPESAPTEAATAAERPASYSPMLAETGSMGVARGADAWAEIKWDGIRAIGTWADGSFTLRARSGTDITARYPELTADGAPHLPATDAVVDGEIVAFDAQGRPSFTRLQNRMHLTKGRDIEREVVRTPIVYMLFDLLHLDGHDLTRMPLRQRRELLEQLASDLEDPVQVPPVFDDVDAAVEMSRQHGLEGVVAKDPDSGYRPGARSSAWLKLKNTRTQEVVIIGIRPGKGDRGGTIGSLLLAVPDDAGALQYVGKVGTGFTDRMLRDLSARLDLLRTDEAPAEGVPRPEARDALWVRPELVGEVEFADWTPGGILRHSRWRGLRPDKSPAEVRREA